MQDYVTSGQDIAYGASLPYANSYLIEGKTAMNSGAALLQNVGCND